MQRIIAALSLLFCATTFVAAADIQTPTRRPNIVFLLIDDMGYADLSCYGQKKISTPNIDRMASEGVRFTQFYVNSPICSPSRTALMTGQYPARWKITSFLESRQSNTNRGMAQWLDLKAPSLARTLHDAGYTTGHFGKWHLGGQRDVGDAPLVAEYGFDKVITSFEGLGDRYLPLMDAFDGKPAKKYDLGSASLGHGNITWVDRSTMTTAYTKAAMAFIEDAGKGDKPFYVNLWLNDVHSPFFPPAALRGDAAKETLYLGVTKSMDDQVNALFDLIKNDPKLRDNTLVIIASDNGPEPGAGSAAPFRGHKGNLYEGGIREPLIAWGPGLLGKASGTTDTTSVMAGMDLAPSLLAITGVATPADIKFDGEDRSAALLGRDHTTPRARPIFWIRPPDRPGPPNNRFPDLAVRDGDWKLTCDYEGNGARLINLAADIGEVTDVAAQQPDRVRQMRDAVLAWEKTLPMGRPPAGAATATPPTGG